MRGVLVMFGTKPVSGCRIDCLVDIHVLSALGSEPVPSSIVPSADTSPAVARRNLLDPDARNESAISQTSVAAE